MPKLRGLVGDAEHALKGTDSMTGESWARALHHQPNSKLAASPIQFTRGNCKCIRSHTWAPAEPPQPQVSIMPRCVTAALCFHPADTCIKGRTLFGERHAAALTSETGAGNSTHLTAQRQALRAAQQDGCASETCSEGKAAKQWWRHMKGSSCTVSAQGADLAGEDVGYGGGNGDVVVGLGAQPQQTVLVCAPRQQLLRARDGDAVQPTCAAAPPTADRLTSILVHAMPGSTHNHAAHHPASRSRSLKTLGCYFLK